MTTGTVSRTLKCSCGHIFVVSSRQKLLTPWPFGLAPASTILEVQDEATSALFRHLSLSKQQHHETALVILEDGTIVLPVIADLVIAAYLRVPGNQRPHGDTP